MIVRICDIQFKLWVGREERNDDNPHKDRGLTVATAPFPAGPVAMLVTPFRNDWSVDIPALARVAELAIEQGARGLAVHGLASEGYMLTDAERAAIIACVAEVDRTGFVLAGVDHESTAGSVALARMAAEAGATALMAMPPKSSGGELGRLVDHFAEVEQQSNLPIVVQDAPRASGIGMDVDTLTQVVRALGLTSAIKVEDALPPLKIARLMAAAPGGRTALYGGAGGRRFLAELDAGAIGTMVGPAYIDAFAELQALHGGDRGAAASMFEAMLPLLTAVDGNEWYALVQKALLHRAGVIANPGLRPPAFVPPLAYLDGLVAQIAEAARRYPRIGAALGLNTMEGAA